MLRVTSGHFRSRDWQRSRSHHSIHHSRKHDAVHKHHGSMFYRTGDMPIEVLHCGNRNFRPFWLTWPWPWPDDLHIRIWPVFCVRKWTSYIKASESYRLTDIHIDIHIPTLYTTPLRGWSTNQKPSQIHNLLVAVIIQVNQFLHYRWEVLWYVGL